MEITATDVDPQFAEASPEAKHQVNYFMADGAVTPALFTHEEAEQLVDALLDRLHPGQTVLRLPVPNRDGETVDAHGRLVMAANVANMTQLALGFLGSQLSVFLGFQVTSVNLAKAKAACPEDAADAAQTIMEFTPRMYLQLADLFCKVMDDVTERHDKLAEGHECEDGSPVGE